MKTPTESSTPSLYHHTKDYYISLIDKIFHENSAKEAHQQVIPILKEMAHEPEILYEILAKQLTSNDLFTETRNGPVIAFNLQMGSNYRIQVHCFLPLPDRSTNISHNWIHHHDNRPLTTVNVFGEDGYETILFKKDFSYNTTTKRTELSIEKESSHPLYNVAYIPPFVPHVLFIPPKLTITYALWSTESKVQSMLLHSQFRKIIEKPIKKLAKKIHAKKLLDLVVSKHSHSRQFAPDGDHFKCVGYREYTPSTNENYVQNFFYILQRVGFKDDTLLNTLKEKSIKVKRFDVVNLIEQYLKNDTIDDIYDPNHILTPEVNFTKESILEAVNF